MAPSITSTLEAAPLPSKAATPENVQAVKTLPAPLPFPAQNSNLLSNPHHDSTPIIGTEFHPGFQVSSLLNSPDDLRDLASLVSHRGVVFFRDQDITPAQQRQLVQALGELSGKPKSSNLHVHPLTKKNGKDGDQITIISSIERSKHEETRKEKARIAESFGWDKDELTQFGSHGWHSDITFENVPSDYAILKVHTHPETGGDTLWASAYEVYDRISPSFRAYLETLSAVHNADRFKIYAAQRGDNLRLNRGSPENNDASLTSVHPVIRTNPVTGWKGVFVNRDFTKRILGVTVDESQVILNYLFSLVHENHDLQVRFRWERYPEGHQGGDVALWDNRSTFHTATDDYIETGGVRLGDRAVSLGERPFFDPESKSRREDLGLPAFKRVY